MSLPSRLALMDVRTVASNPGRLSLQYFRYAIHFPFWPVCLATGLVGALTATAIRPGLWWMAALTAGLNALCWLRVRLHFRLGCVNPAKVLASNPFTLAVLTDLTTCETPYPVIKILHHPIPRGCSFKVGDRCVSVATYTGSSKARHWEDFFPILADCASDDRPEIEKVQQTISAEDWSELERGLEKIPLPLKQGIYPLTTA
jgi:hypothetical protein